MECNVEKIQLWAYNFKKLIKGMLTINLIVIVIEMEIAIKFEAIPEQQTMGDKNWSNTHKQRVRRLTMPMNACMLQFWQREIATFCVA